MVLVPKALVVLGVDLGVRDVRELEVKASIILARSTRLKRGSGGAAESMNGHWASTVTPFPCQPPMWVSTSYS